MVEYFEDSGRLIFAEGYEEDTFTLMAFVDGKAVQVGEEVAYYDVLPCGDVLFIDDYSENRGEGTLKQWDGKKTTQIDDEVSSVMVMPVYYFNR